MFLLVKVAPSLSCHLSHRCTTWMHMAKDDRLAYKRLIVLSATNNSNPKSTSSGIYGLNTPVAWYRSQVRCVSVTFVKSYLATQRKTEEKLYLKEPWINKENHRMRAELETLFIGVCRTFTLMKIWWDLKGDVASWYWIASTGAKIVSSKQILSIFTTYSIKYTALSYHWKVNPKNTRTNFALS